ncbi:Hypothetical predicted protein [Xyrichtys novacula]|uniref:Uncharacterized protein n=1 Tax=Xyrichtys novacula TaxID=13765 RepID=A0AAV1EYD4_XYRNO|nr:Hypothetical predicted protein [Xyrichtys novacula]
MTLHPTVYVLGGAKDDPKIHILKRIHIPPMAGEKVKFFLPIAQWLNRIALQATP